MSRNWIDLPGRVVVGYKIASGGAETSPYPAGSIAMQVPVFRELGLDLSTCFPATLNVSISPRTFAVTSPQYTFTAVKWSPHHPAENFSFSPCRIAYGDRLYSGFLYYPDPATKIDHFHDASTMEIISARIRGIRYGCQLRVSVDKDEITIDPV